VRIEIEKPRKEIADPPFHIDCECGNRISVTEDAAGARLNCSCGRIVQVPGLYDLRQRVRLSLTPGPTTDSAAFITDIKPAEARTAIRSVRPG